ncbi:MAG: aryl-sulfate sulfotransferase [Cyclobacteriaceae bacterium]
MKKITITFLSIIVFGCTPKEDLLIIQQKENFSVVEFSMKDPGSDAYEIQITNETGFKKVLSNCKRDSTYSVIGLLSNSTYDFSVSSEERDFTQSFTTDSLPSSSLYDFEMVVDDYRFPGKLLFHQSDSFGRNQVLLSGSDAQIYWYGTFLYESGPIHFTKDQTIFNLFGFKDLYEVDLFGNTLFQASLGEAGFTEELHHDIKSEDGIIYSMAKVVHRNLGKNIQSISGTDTLGCDAIHVFDREMNKIWEWTMFDSVNPFDKNFTPRILNDWGHANSLFKDVDGHYLISFRNLNQIWKVHSETGALLYIFGENGDIQPLAEDQFKAQHYAHINKNGELMIFDNMGAGGQTRAISFEIDETNKKATKKLEVLLPKEMFSAKRGSVQIIDDNKLLFCSTLSNNIVVTDMEGTILWNMKIPRNTYRVEYVTGLYF